MVAGEFPSDPEAQASVEIPQYTVLQVLAVWAAAALPMAALAWLVAPALADELGGEGDVPIFKALVICLTVGLIWQFVLVSSSCGASRGRSSGRRSEKRSGSVRRGAREAAVAAAGCG